MKLGENLQRYRDRIFEHVFQYAFENSVPRPMLTHVKSEWIGTIFDIQNIEKDLHWDLLDDLKTLGLYDEIVKHTDHYVILPDVFSNHPIPKNFIRNEYDMDRRNIVILNGKLFELYDVNKKTIKYNHNGKLYYFYKEQEMGDFFAGIKEGPNQNDIESFYIKEYGWASDRVPKEWIEKYKDPNMLKLWIDKDNIMHEDPKEFPPNTPLAGICFRYPYLEFDYSEVHLDSWPDIPGLKSIGWRDIGMRPKWYNIEKDRYNIYDPDVIMSTTAVVLFKDGTYWFENLWSDPVGKYVERTGKHTIMIKQDPSIQKVFMFIKPIEKPMIRPDTTYYKSLNQNTSSAKYMRKHACRTDALYEFLLGDRNMSLEKIIDYGYQYDLDVLKVIQQCFPIRNRIDNTDIVISKYFSLGLDYQRKETYVPIMRPFRLLEDTCNHLDQTIKIHIRDNNVRYAIKEIKRVSSMILQDTRILDILPYQTRLRSEIEDLIAQIHRYLHIKETNLLLKDDVNKLYKVLSEDWFALYDKITIGTIPKRVMNVYEKPKLMVHIWNPLQKYPSLFVGNRLYAQDYKIEKMDDADVLVIDPKEFFQLHWKKDVLEKRIQQYQEEHRITNPKEPYDEKYRLTEYHGLTQKVDPFYDEEWITRELRLFLLKYPMQIFMTDYPYNQIVRNGSESFSKQSGKICRDLYRDSEYCLDRPSDVNWKSKVVGTNFVNGFLSHEFQSNVGMCYSKSVFPDYDGLTPWINTYDFTNGIPFLGHIRIWMGLNTMVTSQFTRTDVENALLPIPQELKRDFGYLCFDQQGVICNDKINVLSKEFVDMNAMTICDHTLLTKYPIVHFFFPRLQDEMYQYDLEIDLAKVKKGNLDCNTRVMKDEYIVAMYDQMNQWSSSEFVFTERKHPLHLGINVSTMYPFLSKNDRAKLQEEAKQFIHPHAFQYLKEVAQEAEVMRNHLGYYINNFDTKSSKIMSELVTEDVIRVDNNMEIGDLRDVEEYDKIITQANSYKKDTFSEESKAILSWYTDSKSCYRMIFRTSSGEERKTKTGKFTWTSLLTKQEAITIATTSGNLTNYFWNSTLSNGDSNLPNRFAHYILGSDQVQGGMKTKEIRFFGDIVHIPIEFGQDWITKIMLDIASIQDFHQPMQTVNWKSSFFRLCQEFGLCCFLRDPYYDTDLDDIQRNLIERIRDIHQLYLHNVDIFHQKITKEVNRTTLREEFEKIFKAQGEHTYILNPYIESTVIQDMKNIRTIQDWSVFVSMYCRQHNSIESMLKREGVSLGYLWLRRNQYQEEFYKSLRRCYDIIMEEGV